MSSESPDLLQEVARELSSRVDREAIIGRDESKHQIKLSTRKKFITQFGQVVEAFLRLGSIKLVSEETGISVYILRQHFFSNPEFMKLFKDSNEEVFLSATQQIRDRQLDFLNRARDLAEEALAEMERLLSDSEDEHIRFKVAQDLLDRDPRISRTKRLEGSGPKVQVDVKILQLAAQAAREVDSYDKTTKQVDSSQTRNE